MDKNEDVEIFSQSFVDNSGVTVDQTSFELAFISLLPLINASQNLPNRVFYGKTIDTAEKKQILPFAVTKSSNVNQSKTYFGWIDSHVFLAKIVKMANLNSDIKLVGLAENRLTIETRTIENKSPPLTIAVLEKNTVQPSLFINFEVLETHGTLMLLCNKFIPLVRISTFINRTFKKTKI